MGAWLGIPPLASVEWNWRGLATGVGATAPLLLGLWWCRRTAYPPMVRLVDLVEQRLAPLFAGRGPGELALIAALAGLGEELLFRGVLQPALAGHIPAWLAAAVVGAGFGLVHWITPTYALLAGLVGTYLGLLALVAGNLLVPIVAHALYDLVALSLLARVKQTPTKSVL